MRVTNRSVTLGFGIASFGCLSNDEPGNTIGHDLVVTNDTAVASRFGSSLRIGENHVGLIKLCLETVGLILPLLSVSALRHCEFPPLGLGV